MALTTIIVSGQESGSNASLLAATRLQSIPKAGKVLIEMQSDLAVAANNFVASLSLPGGDIPFENLLVPAGDAAGELDSRKAFIATFNVSQGGTVQLSVVETGAAIITWRVTFVG